MTAAEFEESLEGLNNDIDNSNRLSSIPRFLSWIFATGMYAVTAVTIFFLWKLLVFLITGRSITTVIIGLILAIVMVPSAFSLEKKLAPLVKKGLLKLLSLKDYEEKFTFLEYVDREDVKKKLSDDLKYYTLCDELRQHLVTDASVNYDGSECEVDVSYADENSKTDIVRRIRLPLRSVSDIDDIIVDLNRRCVLLPDKEAET